MEIFRNKFCKFQMWQGKCPRPSEENSDYCNRHKDRKCRMCKTKQAVKECGSLVCEGKVCEDCRCDHH
jgi:hypothetical protein